MEEKQVIKALAALAQPGGDAAAREPWRVAAAVLFATGHRDEIETFCAPLVGSAATKTVHTMLQRDLNCPRSSSAGRWFDAAAGALGISVRQSHEAEAAMALEQLTQRVPDLILLDINMPRLAGDRALMRILEINPRTGGDAHRAGQRF